MKRILFTCALALLCSCTNQNAGIGNESADKNTKQQNVGSEAKKLTAEMTALNFINSYVENCNKMGEAQTVLLWVNENPLASQVLRNELRILVENAIAKDPEMGLGFDPLLNAQDYPEKGFEVEKIGEENVIYLKGVEMPDFKLTMKMVEKNGTWLVEGCGAVNMLKL